MKLSKDEHLVLSLENEWKANNQNILLTNERILFIRDENITSEIRLNHIAEAYVAPSFLGAPSIKIRIFGGRIIKVTFQCVGPRAVFGTSYILPKQKAIAQRWVRAINRLLPG
ncbi:TPA: hypothetical protein EYP70_03015 [Candidatus Bathyarchaeota archaeon]|nr:hypothetical protein [Candidatus Bathyarchaeota archaeon]